MGVQTRDSCRAFGNERLFRLAINACSDAAEDDGAACIDQVRSSRNDGWREGEWDITTYVARHEYLPITLLRTVSAAILTSLQDDLTVSPVPGELAVWASESSGLGEYPQMSMSPLRQGEWSIIVCHEDPDVAPDPSISLKVRYAFATLDVDGSTRVLYVEQFLHEMMFAYEAKSLGSILAKWEAGIKSMTEERLQWRKRSLDYSCERKKDRG